MLKKIDARIREAQGRKSRQTGRLNGIYVLTALMEKPLSFSDLLKITGFSKPVLSKHLKTLMKTDDVYKDTIKPGETTNPAEVGKIVYRGPSDDIIPIIVEAIEEALDIPKPVWSEKSKVELRRHFEGIAKVIFDEDIKRAGKVNIF